ncbi:MAG: hypothetical protein ABFE02_12295 [Sulfuricella sp.]
MEPFTPLELATISISSEAQELIAFSKTFLATVEAIQITTPEEAQTVVEQLRLIKETAKAIDDTRKEYTKPLDEQKQAYMDTFRPAADVLAKAEKIGKGALAMWDTEQRRLAAIEAENLRKTQEADRQRLAEEQKKAEALLNKADEAAAAGDTKTAEALESQAAAIQETAVPCPVVRIAAPEKPQGSSVRKIWKARVIDAALVPNEYKTINQKALDAYAAAMKAEARIPGVEFYTEESVSIR